MRKIIYTRPDGGLSVVHPVINTHPRREGITETEAEQRAWNKLPKDAINPRWIDVAEIPTDRTFRNAWKDAAGRIDHDISKCREITKVRLRAERAPKLAALDIEFMRALEQGQPTEEIVAQKQALRDITNQVDSLSDLEAMKALKA